VQEITKQNKFTALNHICSKNQIQTTAAKDILLKQQQSDLQRYSQCKKYFPWLIITVE